MASGFRGKKSILGERNLMKGFGLVTRKYLGKPFNECNCLQLIFNIYKDMNIDIKSFQDLYKGHNMYNYLSYWKEDPINATKDMMEVLKKTGKDVNPKFLHIGDIVVIEYQNKRFPSIYLGGNVVMVATIEKGIVTLTINGRIKPILARRLF